MISHRRSSRPILARPALVAAGLVALVVSLSGAEIAAAGTVDGGYSSSTPRRGCTGGCGDSYSVSAPSQAAGMVVDPADRSRTHFEAAWADFTPPEWPHAGAVQGYSAIVDVTGSVVGRNWRAVVCRPGAEGVCDGPATLWTGGPTALGFGLPTAAQPIRVALQYIGDNGNPDQRAIVLRASVRWVEIDAEAPRASVLVGGRPLADGGVYGLGPDDEPGDGTTVVVDGEDNTDVSGASVSIDGRERGTAPGEPVRLPDGLHSVATRLCDIAAPANCAAASASVRVDTQAPRVLLPSQASSSERPTVSVIAGDVPVGGYASGLDAVSLRIGETVVAAEATPTRDGYSIVPSEPVADGAYPVSVTVSDSAGNRTDTVDAEAVLTVDTAAPSVAPLSPPAGSRLAESPAVVSASASDGVGVVRGDLRLDGLSVPAELDEGLLEYRPETRLCAGTHTAVASATDIVGRTAVATWSFRVLGRLTRTCRRARCRQSRLAVRTLSRRHRTLLTRERRARRGSNRVAVRTVRIERVSTARALRTARRNVRRYCG